MLSQAQFHRREAPKPPLRTSRRSPQNVLKPMCKCVPEQICSLVFDHMYVSSAVRHRQKFGNKYPGKKYGRGCAKVKMCLWNLHARHCAPQEAGEEKVELPSSPGQETIRDFHLTKTKKHNLRSQGNYGANKCRIFLRHSETMPNLRSTIFVKEPKPDFSFEAIKSFTISKWSLALCVLGMPMLWKFLKIAHILKL